MHVLGQNGPLVGMQLEAKGIPRPDGCSCTATSAALGVWFFPQRTSAVVKLGLARLDEKGADLNRKTLAAHNTTNTEAISQAVRRLAMRMMKAQPQHRGSASKRTCPNTGEVLKGHRMQKRL
jgi:hypothetical protein